MSVVYGCVVPHSPNLVPEVSERALAASQTREAMSEVGIRMSDRKVTTVVIVSPHGPFLLDAFGVWDAEQLTGSMERFQAPEIELTINVDRGFATTLMDVCDRMELPVGPMDGLWDLDRGITVPGLYLFSDGMKVLPVATSMLGWDEHWLFGTAIANAAKQSGENVALVASSNLSHRVSWDSPHGYDARGADFDARVRKAFAESSLRQVLDMPMEIAREASECGMGPLLVLGGAFDGANVEAEEISYEHPFGIGYLVAQIEPTTKKPVARLRRTEVSVGAGATARW